ncbi:uncharacterized protein LOC134258675 [Saccostrea cucullata]|uniref:uncharacterized protein LOC134258675 n=1 Tax=Saccostrea cuccullata TaxID=36930 RepID=UPI002ED62B86
MCVALSKRERFLLVYKPTKRYLDPRRHRIVVVLTVILVPLVIAIPMCIFSGTVEIKLFLLDGQNRTKCSCESSAGRFVGTEENYLVFLFILSLLLILATALFYIPVGMMIIRKHRELKSSQNAQDFSLNSIDAVASATSDSNDVETNLKAERRENRRRPNKTLNFHMMFGVIVISYLLAYIPTFSLLLIQRGKPSYWLEMTGWELTTLLLLRRFHLFSNIINPFVYGYFDITFRDYYHSLLRTMFQCFRKAGSSNCNDHVSSIDNETVSTKY